MAVLVFEVFDAVAELVVDPGQVGAGGTQCSMLAEGVAVPAAFAGLLDQPGDFAEYLVQFAAGEAADCAHDTVDARRAASRTCRGTRTSTACGSAWCAWR